MEIRGVDPSQAARPEASPLLPLAREFEQILLQQLAAGLTGSEEDDEAGAATGAYASMLPDALAKGVSEAGGAGLAEVLVRSLEGRS